MFWTVYGSFFTDYNLHSLHSRAGSVWLKCSRCFHVRSICLQARWWLCIVHRQRITMYKMRKNKPVTQLPCLCTLLDSLCSSQCFSVRSLYPRARCDGLPAAGSGEYWMIEQIGNYWAVFWLFRAVYVHGAGCICFPRYSLFTGLWRQWLTIEDKIKTSNLVSDYV